MDDYNVTEQRNPYDHTDHPQRQEFWQTAAFSMDVYNVTVQSNLTHESPLQHPHHQRP